MTARLPTPGGDNGDWGDILNAYLSVSLASDGTLNSNTVGSSQIQSAAIGSSQIANNAVGTNQLATSSVTATQIAAGAVGTAAIANNAVTNTQLDSPTQATLASVAGKYTKPGGGIPSTDLSSAVQANLTSASTSVQSVNSITPTSGNVAITASSINAVANTTTVNGHALSSNITLSASDVSAIPTSQLGAASGVATLNSSSQLTSSQIPSSVVSAMSGSASVLPLIVYQASGSDDKAGILAAFNAMKVSGHATGILKLLGVIQLNETLTLDGGYTNIGYVPGGAGEQFVLDMSGAVITAGSNIGVALAIQGFYGARIDARFFNGGSRRKVADGAITATQSTLTSTTAAFVASDVGKFVRLEGAGLSGSAPLCARIQSITNSTTAVLDTVATTTVSGAALTIMDIALHLQNMLSCNAACYAETFAGLAFHIDDQNSQNTAVQESTIREIKTNTCGMGIFMRTNVGDFGQIQDAWIDTDIDGSVWDACSNIGFGYISGYAGTTQTVAFLFSGCTDMEIAKMSIGDRASECLFKAVGPSNNFGTIGELYLTAYMPGASPTIYGAKVEDLAGIVIQTLRTQQCLRGLWVRGTTSDGLVMVLEHSSAGNDGNPLYVEAGVVNTTANVEARVRYRYCQNEAAVIASNITGGTIALRGTIITYNNLGSGSVYGINNLSTAAILDVTGLFQSLRSTTAGSINLATQDNIRGVNRARLQNNLVHTAAPATISSPTTGTPVQNATERAQVIWLRIRLNVPASGGTAEFEVHIGPSSSTTVQVGDTFVTNQSAGTAYTDQRDVSFVVPPWWWWSWSDDSNCVIEKVTGYYLS